MFLSLKLTSWKRFCEWTLTPKGSLGSFCYRTFFLTSFLQAACFVVAGHRVKPLALVCHKRLFFCLSHSGVTWPETAKLLQNSSKHCVYSYDGGFWIFGSFFF